MIHQKSPWIYRLFSLTLLFLFLTISQGCVGITLGRITKGNPIDGKKILSLKKGKSGLQDVLAALGAPIEIHVHPEGKALLYRFQSRNIFNLSVGAKNFSLFLSFLEPSQTLSQALENLNFTYEIIHEGQDILVVLIDKKGILQGMGYREKTKKMPRF